MKYSIKISCENQAKVINFTSELKGVMWICILFRTCVKSNYTIDVSPYCKKHRGKAVSLEEALQQAKELRFYKSETVPEYKDEEYLQELLTICIPYCSISRDIVDWGTFFKIDPSSEVDIKPDMSKIASAFEKVGLDLHLASSGSYYTHNKIKFQKISPFRWKIFRICVNKSVTYIHKNIEL